MGCPNRSTEVLGGMWTVGAQSIFKLSKGKNIIGQPNSYILAKKGMWLLFAIVLRICLKLN